MIRNIIHPLLLSFLVALTVHNALAADDSALLDALVRKGVLTDKEAEEISTEAIKETAGVTAGKLQVGGFVISGMNIRRWYLLIRLLRTRIRMFRAIAGVSAFV